ncbi:amidohydrolase [Limimaricola cinnabarinus]|uniref:amidohydrolase n=1 Tax=Limimaricola cinnabarinus TaxID=1125964 RepID=UPI00249082CF|nr:amidohydrolase [Limimaricola cinnabarinus]
MPESEPPRLDAAALAELTAWRHELHRHPELSGQETATAARVAERLERTRPDMLLTGLGGHGVVAVYEGAAPGPTLLLRCELDALPIEETGLPDWRSTVPGRGHLCGHDGHMAILAGMAELLGRHRPRQGRAVLLFQPSEEDGQGAAAVIADPAFARIAPDWAFALHNMPGLPLGHAALRPGPAACASRGLRIALTGRTAHASQPETGRSPMEAISALMPALTALGAGRIEDAEFALVTITHARMGAPAFGIAPGEAELFVTLRSLTDARMTGLVREAEALARQAAERHGLGLAITHHDVFRHCENDREAVARLAAALEAEAVPHGTRGQPMRASEDFGRFADGAKTALMLLGAGRDRPDLHNPDYDFPDALIETGLRCFARLTGDMLGYA